MSIASEITRINNAKASLKTSLEAKGATVSQEAKIDAYPSILDDIPVALLQDKEVNVSGGTTLIEPDQGYTGLHSVSVTAEGGGAVEEKDVNFFDYDGTLVKSYTGEEIQALSVLPNAPDHSQDEVPLTFDGWNWSLADIKTYNTSYPNAIINVGANYHTTDDKSHFYWNITSDTDGNGVAIALQGYSQGDTVDWGDGSAVETITSYSLTHIYTSIGEYHCIVDSTSTYYSIGSSTRRGKCEKLTKAYLSSDVTNITNSAFQSCYSLQLITIPNEVTNIGSNAFSDCHSLQSITIPNEVTSIENISFGGCHSIQSINIPNSVTNIGSNAFSSCSLLQSVTIPSNVTSIGGYAFNYCYSLQSVIIPNSVTSIGGGTFSGCYSLQSTTIPSSMTSIGGSVFANCYSLQSITIPGSVTSIGGYAFDKCHSIQSINIPNEVTSIGDSIFSSCYSLYSITLLPTIPPTLGTSVLSTSYTKKIYIPYSSDHSILAAYQSATNWSNYASIMEELPE